MRRETKKQRTREALIEAAYALFRERGVDAVTTDEIADAAGVSRRTFFRYFPTKESVIFPYHQERVEHFRALLAEEVEGETGFGAVRRACLSMAQRFYDDREQMLAQYELVSASPTLTGLEMMLDRRFEEAMVEAVVRREGKGVVARRRAEIIASATMGVVRATMRDWFERGAKQSLVRIGEDGFEMLERGIGPAVR